MELNVMHLGLSYACNMSCSHCFTNKSQDILKKEDYYHIIDEVYDMGLFVLYYTYGEPLYCPFFFEIVDYARAKGIVQVLMTNGYLVDEKMAYKIKQSGIAKVFVSLDHSDKEKHDENRGVKGAGEAAVRALKYLNGIGVNCGIATTVTEKNVECLEKIENLASTLNIKTISFLRERRNGMISPMSESLKQIYFEFFQGIIKKERSGIMFHDAELLPILKDLYRKQHVSQETYEKYFEMNRCHKKNTVCIEPNGDVSRCNLNKSVIGNVAIRSIKECIQGSDDCGEN